MNESLVTPIEKIKFRFTQISSYIKKIIGSPIIIALIALMCVLSNILGLEIPIYIASSVIWILICLFGKDLLALSSFCLFYFSPSIINNPALNPNSIFYSKSGPYLYIVIGLIIIDIICAIISIIIRKGKEFFLEKRKLLNCLLLFCMSCFIGGIGKDNYNFLNFRYVLVFTLSLLVFYYILTGSVNWDKVKLDYLFYLGMFGGLVVATELIYIYISTDNIISESGVLNTSLLYTGWGHYNNIGGMIAMFLPAPFYFSITKKYGFIYFFVGIFLYNCVILSNSRGSILVGSFILMLIFIYLIFNKKNRIINIILIILTIIGLSSFLYFDYENIKIFFSRIFEQRLDSDGRIEIYKAGLKQFLDNPIFGNGFYACTAYQWKKVEALSFVPARWHNTIIQVLASCGIIGLITYLMHRVQTVYLVFKCGISTYKVFLFLSILALIGISLVDCHMFNIGPTLIYSVYLAFLDKADEIEI